MPETASEKVLRINQARDSAEIKIRWIAITDKFGTHQIDLKHPTDEDIILLEKTLLEATPCPKSLTDV